MFDCRDEGPESRLVLDIAFVVLSIGFLAAGIGYVAICDRLMKRGDK